MWKKTVEKRLNGIIEERQISVKIRNVCHILNQEEPIRRKKIGSNLRQ